MHTDTGEIRREEDIPEKEKKSGKWARVIPAMVGALSAMSPDERLQQLALERNVEHREKLKRKFFSEPGNKKSKKRAKRKMQKLSRRRNRGRS
jgi:hypothetical protein